MLREGGVYGNHSDSASFSRSGLELPHGNGKGGRGDVTVGEVTAQRDYLGQRTGTLRLVLPVRKERDTKRHEECRQRLPPPWCKASRSRFRGVNSHDSVPGD